MATTFFSLAFALQLFVCIPKVIDVENSSLIFSWLVCINFFGTNLPVISSRFLGFYRVFDDIQYILQVFVLLASCLSLLTSCGTDVLFFCQKKAMQVAVSTMMGQMGPKDNQFSNAGFSTGLPFPFPPPPTSGPSSSGFPYQQPSTFSSAPNRATTPSPAASGATVTVDASATETESLRPAVVKDEAETKAEAKRSGIVTYSN